MLLSLPISALSRWRHRRLVSRLELETRIVALLTFNRQGLCGAQISGALNVWSGSLYPALARLEADGTLSSIWEATDTWTDKAKPRRRIYWAAVKGDPAS